MRPAWPASLLLPVLLGSCGLVEPSPCVSTYVRPDVAALTRDLNAAKARWQAAGTANYTYTQHSTGFAPDLPLTVTVRAGQVVAVSPEGQTSLGTVEDMFGAISQDIAGIPATDCYVVRASYDPADGHPTELSVSIERRQIADGFGGWRITAFAAAP